MIHILKEARKLWITHSPFPLVTWLGPFLSSQTGHIVFSGLRGLLCLQLHLTVGNTVKSTLALGTCRNSHGGVFCGNHQLVEISSSTMITAGVCVDAQTPYRINGFIQQTLFEVDSHKASGVFDLGQWFEDKWCPTVPCSSLRATISSYPSYGKDDVSVPPLS